MDIKISNQPVSQPSYQSKRYSFAGTLFEILFFTVAAIVVYAYLVVPKQRDYVQISTELKTIKAKQVEVERQKQAMDQLVEDLAANPEGVLAAEQVVPLDAKPSRLYVLLENMMQTTGLVTGAISVETDAKVVVAGAENDNRQVKSDRKLRPVSITVSASGNIDQLGSFLHLVETSSRIFDLASLDIGQSRGEQVVFKIGLRAYTYPASSEADKPVGT